MAVRSGPKNARSPRSFRPRVPSTGWRILDLAIAGVVLAGLGALAFQAPSPEAFAGPARAVDGDTLDMLGMRVRIQGIDAPELHQTCVRQERPWPCGEASRQALATAVSGRSVACTARSRDRYARPVARCTVDGVDLGARQIAAGMAISFGRGAYEAEQATARAAGRGIWAGSFQRPADYRADHPRLP